MMQLTITTVTPNGYYVKGFITHETYVALLTWMREEEAKRYQVANAPKKSEEDKEVRPDAV